MFKYYLAKLIKKLRRSAIGNSRIDKTSYISSGNTILNSTIGRYSYTGYDTTILYSDIGNFCSIGSDVKIGSAGHPMEYVSTSPLFVSGRNVFGKHFNNVEFEPYKKTLIGNDVWIGQNVLIKSGITIGNGAVIGMGAVLTKNVGPYEIWAGNPARFIRKRFDEKTIGILEKIQWWNWDDDKIKENKDLFINVSEFCNVEREM